MSKEENLNEKEPKKHCCCGNSKHRHDDENKSCGCSEGGECSCEHEHEEAACASETDLLKAELAKAQEDAKENHNKFLRALADLDTFRRRVQRDMEDMRKFSIQPLVEELIPALDNLELGLQHAKSGGNSGELVAGIEMVLSQIKKTLENFGVIEINPIGQDFDPNLHDSVAHTPSEEYAENKVSATMRKGYTLNGRLVRPASVIVSSGAVKE